MQNKNNGFSAIEPFCAAGLYLVPIPPVGGKPTKAPRTKGWNQPKGLTIRAAIRLMRMILKAATALISACTTAQALRWRLTWMIWR